MSQNHKEKFFFSLFFFLSYCMNGYGPDPVKGAPPLQMLHPFTWSLGSEWDKTSTCLIRQENQRSFCPRLKFGIQ